MSTLIWLMAGFFCGAIAERSFGSRLRAAGRRLADRLPRAHEEDWDGPFGWHCGECSQAGMGATRAEVEAQGDEHWRTVHHATRRWQREVG